MAEEKQVLVRFITKLPPELQVPATEVAVPTSLKRYGLSQIINHLLALDPVRPFDFIIDGELVRRSLEQHLLDHKISAESVIEVEYVPAVIPPEPQQAIPQDDWVTAVAAVAGGGLLLSGAADGIVRVWGAAGDCLLEFPAHKLGVNALVTVQAGHRGHDHHHQQQQHALLSAGKDHSLRLWELQAGNAQQQQQQQAGAAGKASSSSARCVAVYEGHREAVQAVAASPDASLCASGGWDGQLLLWRTGPAVLEEAAAAGAGAEDAAAAGRSKKQKLGKGGAAAAVAPLTLQSAAALPGHVHCVAAVAWPAQDTLFSGGWDHSVRRYDVERATNTDTYNGSKAVYAVAAPGGGSGSGSDVVAFAGSDRVLRVWDTRSAAGEGLAVKSHNAHQGWVSALAWRPGSSHHLASGGHDGAVKLWDIRTAVPLASLQQHGEDAKVLCVGWSGADMLLSGGSDCRMQVYAMSSASAS